MEKVTIEDRATAITRIREALGEMQAVVEARPDSPSERVKFRTFQANYSKYLLGLFDAAVIDYYNTFLGDNQ